MNIDLSLEELKDEKDVCRILFTRQSSQQARRVLVDRLKQSNLTPKEMATFASDLAMQGIIARQNFYVSVLGKLKNLGLILLLVDRRGRKTYVSETQFIPKKRPSPHNSLPAHIWEFCRRWNIEFERE